VTFRSGRHFLQVPGPTNVPERVLRAMNRPTIDHRGPDFARMATEILKDLQWVFRASGPVFVFPSSATGCWEASLVNTLSPGDKVLTCDQGYFADGWRATAERMGLEVDIVPGDWRCGVDPAAVEDKLAKDTAHEYRALLVVHNETSTGITNPLAAVRQALDNTGHPALLMADAVSSLGSMEYEHDAWGVDVTVAGSQKGLMVPPGLGFNAVSEKALEANRSAGLPRSYWDWQAMRSFNEDGFFPYTPATNLLYGLREAISMLREEGPETVFARHQRFAEATRRAVNEWGLEIYCTDPAKYSSALTAVLVPEGSDADSLRAVILDRFDMSLGAGLGRLKGKVFRIGHLGDLNDLMLAGTLCGIEMGLSLAGVPSSRGGVAAALDWLSA